MNNYYVYIYWRLDINEPFYVGMGHNNRWRDLRNRNQHFKRISNKYPIIVEIVKDNLTEEQAHGIEIWLINELVFEYGFSIDIPNNKSRESGMHLVNCTWGGEGVSGGGLCGKKNPLYGKHHAEETKNKQSEIKKGKHHTEETKIKISKSNTGKHNGENNGNAKSIICLNDKKIFKTVLEASMYYNISLHSISKVLIGKHNNCGKKIGKKLKFKYIVWNHNKKYRIK